MVLSLLVFASLSMSVWAHHMLTIEGVAVKYFALTSTLLVAVEGEDGRFERRPEHKEVSSETIENTHVVGTRDDER